MTTSPVLYPDTAEHIDSPPVVVRLLGPVEFADQRLPLARYPMQVFALMASRPNARASIDDFVRELWGDKSPRSFQQTIQTYILRIRDVLEDTDKTVVVTQPGGYRLCLAHRLDLDAARFDHLVAQAERESRDNPKAALDTLLAAFSLWRGEALEDVRKGPLLDAYAAGLRDRYRTALGMRIDIDLRLGGHRSLVDEVAALARSEPAREDWTARLMLALYRSRRAAEALEAFARLRLALAEDHGIDPCPELRLLQQQILQGDPALELNGEH